MRLKVTMSSTKGIEKEVWTLDGRKKILLVTEENRVIKVIKDLGPLSETERLWVQLQPGVPYKEWLKEYEKEQKGKEKDKQNKSESNRTSKTKGK